MQTRLIDTEDGVDACARVALEMNSGLRAGHPWLPSRGVGDYADRIGWMVREGRVFGAFEGEDLLGYLGYFVIEDFRCAGRGAFSPDWCSGVVGGADVRALTRSLIRTVLADCHDRAVRLHAVGVLAHRDDIRTELELTGYGRITLDAGQHRDVLRVALAAAVPGEPLSVSIRRARAADASALHTMSSHLHAHIAASPVLMPMPDVSGPSASEWTTWLAEPDAAAFIAWSGDDPVGYIKAQDPQFDVTFTVHDERVLAINGMYVAPALRRHGIGARLLAAVVREAEVRGKDLVSVDCETTNPEAFAFWTRSFEPLTWGLERRW